MDDKKRNRRPVVCNVCRRRKVRCDRLKPACSSCKRSSVTHLCVYEEREGRGRPVGSTNAAKAERLAREAEAAAMGTFSIKPTSPINQSLPKEQQLKLQLEQQQFKQQFQAQHQYHQNLQNQMAVKYGVTGASDSQPHSGDGTPTLEARFGPVDAYNAQNFHLPPLGSYNVQQNLQNELEYLRSRSQHIETVLSQNPSPPQQPFQQQSLPQYQSHHPSFITPHPSLGNPVMPGSQYLPPPPPQQQQQQQFQQAPPESPRNLLPIDNIDPSLFDPQELVTVFQENSQNFEYLDLESNGFFGPTSFTKKDEVQTLFYLNLQALDEKLRDEKPTARTRGGSDRFSSLLHNKRSKVENFFKKDTMNLNEIVNKISKILPSKKIVWLICDKFFTSISDPYCPILDVSEFTDDVSKIIGPREMVESKIKFNIDFDDNYDLVTLLHLISIVRIIQLSLITTIKLDKQNNYLLKNSQISNEYDHLIDILTIIVENCNISNITKLKITLMGQFLNMFGFNSATDQTNKAIDLAISLNLNNKIELKEDVTLTQTWLYTYYLYYQNNLLRGLPVLLNHEIYQLEYLFRPDSGKTHNKSLEFDFKKQTELDLLYQRLFDKIYKLSPPGVPLASIYSSMNDIEEYFSKNYGSFQDIKNSLVPNYSQKIVRTINIFTKNHVFMNLFGLLAYHFEKNAPGTKGSFVEHVENMLVSYIETIDNSFDILRNYTSYFHSGFEFFLIPSILTGFHKVLRFIQAMFLRLRYCGHDSIGLLKSIIIILEELEEFSILKNYFEFWRLQNKGKLFLKLVKGDILQGRNDLLNHEVELDGEVITFEKVKSNFQFFKKEELQALESKFDQQCIKFDSEYNRYRDVKTFLEILKVDDIEFDLKLFAS